MYPQVTPAADSRGTQPARLDLAIQELAPHCGIWRACSTVSQSNGVLPVICGLLHLRNRIRE
jgi:hypothetical protein